MLPEGIFTCDETKLQAEVVVVVVLSNNRGNVVCVVGRRHAFRLIFNNRSPCVRPSTFSMVGDALEIVRQEVPFTEGTCSKPTPNWNCLDVF